MIRIKVCAVDAQTKNQPQTIENVATYACVGSSTVLIGMKNCNSMSYDDEYVEKNVNHEKRTVLKAASLLLLLDPDTSTASTLLF